MLHEFQSFFSSRFGNNVARSSWVATLTFVAVALLAAISPQNVAAQSNIGSTNIGSSINCTAVPVTFDTAGTLTAITVKTGGALNLDFTRSSVCSTVPTEVQPARSVKPAAITGTGLVPCVLNTAYNAGESCLVNVNFTPKLAGSRLGAVVLTGTGESSNTVLGTRYLQGTGVGPQTIFAVPKQVLIGPVIGPTEPDARTAKASAGILPAITPQTRTVLLPGYQSTIDQEWAIPYGIAVDAAGNVYIADGRNGIVKKETLQSNGSYVSTEIPGEWNVPVGIAVDGAGNVYVADADDASVYKETLQSDGVTYLASSIGSEEWDYPVGVAVDGAGNVYVADEDDGVVIKETPSGGDYIASPVDVTHFETPVGVAVDGDGNVYVTFTPEADSGVAKETLQSDGSYTISYIGSGWEYPVGIAVDSNGNVYVADPEQGVVVRETFSGEGYTAAYLGEWYSPYELALDPHGVLYVTEDGSYGDCIGCFEDEMIEASPAHLKAQAAGKRPSAAGSFSRKARANDLLNGGAAGSSDTPSVYRVDYSVPPSMGFADTYWQETSTDSPQTVLVNDFGNAALNFNALAYPVDFPEEAGTDFDCTATFSLSPSRNCLLTIDFSPVTTPVGLSTLLSEDIALNTNAFYKSGGYAQAVPVSGTELSNQVASITTLSSSGSPVFALSSVTFHATIVPVPDVPVVDVRGGATPMVAVSSATGTVTFLDGTTPLCSAVVVAGGQAACTTSSLTVGSHPVTASYSGDGLFLPSTSSVFTEVIQDFSIAVSGATSSITVVPGNSAQFTLTVSPMSPATTFPAAITLSVTGLPAGATAVLSPSTIAAGTGSTAVTLTIHTALTSAAAQPASGGQLTSKLAPYSLALLLLPLVGRLRKAGRRFSRMIAILLLLGAGAAALAGLSGCGSGVGFFGTAQRNYTVGVTGTSGALSHTSNVTLTVE